MKRKREKDFNELIYKINETIYFSDCVTKHSTKKLDNLTNTYDEYDLIIDSVGGSVELGIKIYNNIKKSKYIINTIGTGIVAGISILLLLAGKNKSMTKYATLYLTEINSQVKNELINIELKDKFNEIILDNTSNKIIQDQLNNFARRGSFLNSAESLNYGFIDFIILSKKLIF
jgi:ATP-dependent protease ClpP protease subunit